MSSPQPRGVAAAGVLTVLIGAIAVAAIPLVAGVILVRLIPNVGYPAASFSWLSILHFLWIYPVMYVVITVFERVGVRLFPQGRVWREAFELLGTVLALSAMYLVFFETFLGALAAAVVSLLLYLLAKPLIGRMSAPEEPTPPRE